MLLRRQGEGSSLYDPLLRKLLCVILSLMRLLLAVRRASSLYLQQLVLLQWLRQERLLQPLLAEAVAATAYGTLLLLLVLLLLCI